MNTHAAKRIKSIAVTILFWLIFILLFYAFSMILANAGSHVENGMEKRISYAYRGEDKNSLDVMFIGNSDIYRGVSPVDLYQETGITSGISGMPNRNIKSALRSAKDILKYQHPKVLVLETDCMFRGNNFMVPGKGLNRDQCPKAGQRLSEHKACSRNTDSGSGILNSLKGRFNQWNSGIITGLNYESPLLKYHNNWKTLHKLSVTGFKQNFYKYSNKGMAYSHRSKPFDASQDYMSINPGKNGHLSEKNLRYIAELVKLCEKEDIRLVFMTVPSATTWNYVKSDTVQKLADKYGVPYYDYNHKLPENFDWTRNSKDGGNHLNYSGARLLTFDFGHVLRHDMKLNSTLLSENQHKCWKADYEYFHNNIVKSHKGLK